MKVNISSMTSQMKVTWDVAYSLWYQAKDRVLYPDEFPADSPFLFLPYSEVLEKRAQQQQKQKPRRLAKGRKQ